MPAKNSVKSYLENGYYHIYNRGVEKRDIFIDTQDYSVFLKYLKEYLTPKDKTGLIKKLGEQSLDQIEREKVLNRIRLNNFFEEIELLAYCLMPNHFHLLIKQRSSDAIDKFVNSLSTRYVMYFNRRYQRIGHLFQDVYKAVTADSEEQLLHLSRYIHRNPLSLGKNARKHQELYSSLPEFLNRRRTAWVHAKEILNSFGKTPFLDYHKFVEEKDDLDYLKETLIDES